MSDTHACLCMCTYIIECACECKSVNAYTCVSDIECVYAFTRTCTHMHIYLCMCTYTDSAKSSEENVPGPQFSIFVNPSNGFRLPEDPGRPIVMVCVCASTRARLHEYVRFCCSVLQQDEFIEKIASLCDVLQGGEDS